MILIICDITVSGKVSLNSPKWSLQMGCFQAIPVAYGKCFDML